MKTRRFGPAFAALCLILLLFWPVKIDAVEPSNKITVEWLSDSVRRDKTGVPRHAWLEDSRALLLDTRVERDKRTLEIYDPRDGRRTPAFDGADVLSGLKSMSGSRSLSTITWPDAVDSKGRAVAYLIGGDLFLVELADSKVKRLTQTTAEETSPDFSPDGNLIAFIRDNDILAVDWRTGIEKRLTTGATDTLLNGPFSYIYSGEIYQRTPVPYQWSPDSRAIAYLQTDESMVPVSTFVNFRPQTQAVVAQRYPKSGQENPKVRLGIVELSSAETTWVDCGDYEYLSRFQWLPGGREISLQTQDRKQREMKLFFAERATGNSREILVERHPAWVNLGPSSSLQFIENGERFIWLSERDDYQHAYLYDKNGGLIGQLTQGEFMITAGGLVSRSGGLLGLDDSGWVYFIANKKALQERHLYRVRLNDPEVRQLSDGDGIHSISFSPCMQYYLDTFSSVTTPPSLSVHRADGQKLFEISSPARDLVEPYLISFPTFHTFPADDGLELTAMMTLPPDFDSEKRYPAIVYVYGGPGSQQVMDNWNDRWLWHSLLAQEGFAVFVFDVRAGVGKSHRTETSIYKRAYGMQNVRDILSGVEWISGMPFVDPANLGLWGSSGGGCTTLYTLTHSDVFKAGISRVPVSDWYFYDSFYSERYMSTPDDNLDGYEETSSVLAASNLKARLLIMSATYDDNVHIQNTWAFIDKLIEHQIQFELMVYPWRKHGLGDAAAQMHCNSLMLDFWNRNLKTRD